MGLFNVIASLLWSQKEGRGYTLHMYLRCNTHTIFDKLPSKIEIETDGKAK